MGCIRSYPTRGKGALGPLLSALVGASKRETPTSNLTESTAATRDLQVMVHVRVIIYYYVIIDRASDISCGRGAANFK